MVRFAYGKNHGRIVLDLKEFNQQDMVIKKEMIRYTISRVLGNKQGIGSVHIEEVLSLCEKGIGNKYTMPNRNIKVEILHHKIIFQDTKMS